MGPFQQFELRERGEVLNVNLVGCRVLSARQVAVKRRPPIAATRGGGTGRGGHASSLSRGTDRGRRDHNSFRRKTATAAATSTADSASAVTTGHTGDVVEASTARDAAWAASPAGE